MDWGLKGDVFSLAVIARELLLGHFFQKIAKVGVRNRQKQVLSVFPAIPACLCGIPVPAATGPAPLLGNC
jgi:hypothetical protein